MDNIRIITSQEKFVAENAIEATLKEGLEAKTNGHRVNMFHLLIDAKKAADVAIQQHKEGLADVA